MDRCTQAPSRDFNSTPAAREATRIVISSRKTWKTLRSNTEKVWPPPIEAALIEGLEKYRPQSVKNIQRLRRFPKRNCWISQYIKQRTGYDRTPKQVGSRLQQLRDSCQDERILNLLNRKQYEDDEGHTADMNSVHSPESALASDLSGSSAPSSPGASAGPSRISDALAPVAGLHTLVCINLTDPSSFCFSDSHISPLQTACTLNLQCQRISMDAVLTSWKNPSIILCYPRFLKAIEHHCLFKISVDSTVVHLERTPMALPSSINCDQVFLYGTPFPLQYWPSFFASIDMSRCEVSQRIIKRRPMSDDGPDLTLMDYPEDEVVHTIGYSFIDHRKSLMDSPYRIVNVHSVANPMASATRGVDPLGLDAPAFSAKPEPPLDGRAHFPMGAFPSFDSQGSQPAALSPSASQESPPAYYTEHMRHSSDQSTYGDPSGMSVVQGAPGNSYVSQFPSQHTLDIQPTNSYNINLGPLPPPTRLFTPAEPNAAGSISSTSGSTPVDQQFHGHPPSTPQEIGWQQQGQWMEQNQMYRQGQLAHGNDAHYGFLYPHTHNGPYWGAAAEEPESYMQQQTGNPYELASGQEEVHQNNFGLYTPEQSTNGMYCQNSYTHAPDQVRSHGCDSTMPQTMTDSSGFPRPNFRMPETNYQAQMCS